MKIKSSLFVILACTALVCLVLNAKSQAPTSTAPAASPRFSASFSFSFQAKQALPKGVEVEDVTKALNTFFAAHEKSDFSLDEIENIEISASAPSAKGSKALLKDVVRVTVTFSPMK
jgi:hypothetical protein